MAKRKQTRFFFNGFTLRSTECFNSCLAAHIYDKSIWSAEIKKAQKDSYTPPQQWLERTIFELWKQKAESKPASSLQPWAKSLSHQNSAANPAPLLQTHRLEEGTTDTPNWSFRPIISGFCHRLGAFPSWMKHANGILHWLSQWGRRSKDTTNTASTLRDLWPMYLHLQIPPDLSLWKYLAHFFMALLLPSAVEINIK